MSLGGDADDGLYNAQLGVCELEELAPHTRYANTFIQASLLDSYDYAMHGRIFKIEHKDNQIIDVLASFGGLLFKLTGEQSQLDPLRMDMKYVQYRLSACMHVATFFFTVYAYLGFIC